MEAMADQEPQLVILAGPNGAGPLVLEKQLGESTMSKKGASPRIALDDPAEVRTFPDAKELEALAQRAVRRELRIHKALGNPIVVERDGQIVTIPADQIQIDDEPSS